MTIKQYLNTPPNENDFFFASLRKLYQQLFPCKHKWEKVENFTRRCVYCQDEQILGYHQFGNIRTSWKSVRII